MTGRSPRSPRGKPVPGKSGRSADGDSDDGLFHRTMAGVEPLKKKRSLKTTPALDTGTAPKSPAVAKGARARSTPVPQKPARAAEPTPLTADSFAGVDRRTVERMRRGKMPIDARLDLHGHYQDAAQSELNAFISSCAATGCRVVLVITGKGSVGEGGGVLRRRLPDWLNQPACRPHVLAFAGARPEHGGAGAFYVLLRRRRDSQQ